MAMFDRLIMVLSDKIRMNTILNNKKDSFVCSVTI